MERGTITAAGRRCTSCRAIQRCPLRRVTKPRSALMPWSAAMTDATAPHPLPQRSAALGNRLRRLHLACTSGCASRPTTSVSRARRHAQALSSMSSRRGLKRVFRSACPRSLRCLRWHRRLRCTFWRTSRVRRLIRYGSRTEWTYSPSSSTSRWSRPLKRHRKPQRPPRQQEIPDRHIRTLMANLTWTAASCRRGNPRLWNMISIAYSRLR